MVAPYLQNPKKMVKKYLILVLLISNAICAFADFWKSPEIILKYSQNKEYLLKVYPTKYPDNFWTCKYQRQLNKGIVKNSISPCHAVLYRISNSDTIEVWNKPFINPVSPVNAVVANDGKSVVTIDDWYNAGSKHTLVVYGEEGELIEDFTLEDITPFPLEQYSRSISSIHWGGRVKDGNVQYLDNERLVISFRNAKGEERKRIFNIETGKFELSNAPNLATE